MPDAHLDPGTDRRGAPPWCATLPPFRAPAGGPLRTAVLADIQTMLRDRGEFPSPARYADAVDPSRDGPLAEEVVACAFELAPRAAGELAAAWKRAHPSWSPAIDRARAAVALLEGLEESDDGDEDRELRDPGEPHASATPSAPTAAPRVGPMLADGLARYELAERVGAGSNGSVFRAVDRTLSQCGAPAFVAVKLIACLAEEQESRLREAGAARAVAHAGVARVLDAGEVDPEVARRLLGRPAAIFIASELIAGQPLYVWKAMHPARTPAQCAAIAIAVAAALAHCHGKGVAHGDISPANVLIDASGAVHIVDFGLAAWQGAALEGTRAAHDLRRVQALMQWMVRDLPPSRAQRVAIDAVQRRCEGRPERWRLGVRSAAMLTAASVTALAAATAIVLGSLRAPDPVRALFGGRLATRPDLVDLARDLLDDGRPTLWSSEVLLAKVRALRDEATATRRRGDADADLELLSALAALLTPDRPLARVYAALAVDGRIGADEGRRDPESLRRELAWAIVWGSENIDADAQPQEWSRLRALAEELGAPGLVALVRGDAAVRVPGGPRAPEAQPSSPPSSQPTSQPTSPPTSSPSSQPTS